MSGNSFRLLLAILVILIGASVFFFPNKWSMILDKIMPTNNTEEIRSLENENKKLSENNKKSEERIKSLEENYIKDSLSIDTLEKEREEIEKMLRKKDKDIIITKEKLWESINKKKEVEENLKRIKESPLNKTGEDLLYSIKQRIK